MSNYRNQMISKIQIEFPKLRRDLDGEDLRKARLAFYRETLGLNYTPASTTKLSNQQLAAVLDRMTAMTSGEFGPPRSSASSAVERIRSQKSEVRPPLSNVHPLRPTLEGLSSIAATKRGVSCGVEDRDSQTGEIIHLAGNAQAWACARVMEHLEWPDQKRREYIAKRFHRTSEKLLKPDQARSLLVQLLTIAAHAELKRRFGSEVKISRDQTDAEIPKLKQRLGIDRSP